MIEQAVARIGAALRSVVTRGQVTASTVGSRTLLQVTGLDGETKQSVELLLPPGYFARPVPAADVVLLPVLGSRDHLVAVGGDAVGHTLTNMAEGDFGLKSPSGSVVILRATGHVSVQDPSGTSLEFQNNGTVTLTGNLVVTGDMIDSTAAGNTNNVRAMRTIYDGHTHSVPNVASGGSTATSNVPNQRQ